MQLKSGALYQDKRTGKRVKLTGGVNEKEPFVMVCGQDNSPYYVQIEQLAPCDEKGMAKLDVVLDTPSVEKEEVPPVPVIEVPETRLNLNVASAQEISSRVPGVGYRTAKRIVEHRMSLPGEKFSTLEQVQQISNRVNWTAVLEADLIFVS